MNNIAKKFLISVVFFSVAFNASAKKTIIFGTSKDHAGQELVLKSYADEIVFAVNELATTTVDENGNFRFEFYLPTTTTSFLLIESHQAFFFVTPGKEHAIELPPFTPLTQAQRLNPFFRPYRVLLSPITPEENDINELIADFDEVFEFFFARGTFHRNYLDTLKNFKTTMQELFPETNNRFFEDYKAFKYAQLINLNRRLAPTLAIVTYMSKLPAAYENIAFWEAFNQIFNNFFTVFRGRPMQYFFDNALSNQDYYAMISVLEEHFEITDRALQELVIIKGLFDFYNFERSARQRMFLLMNEWRENIKDPRNVRILTDIIERFEADFIVQMAYDFSLPDENGNIRRLSDFRGKFVYLNFCNTRISMSMRDFAMLGRFAEYFSDDLYIINIFTDENKAAMNRFSNVQRENMINLHWDNNLDLKRFFRVVNIPAYVLIDREGQVKLSPAPTPNQRFEHAFHRILSQERRQRAPEHRQENLPWWQQPSR